MDWWMLAGVLISQQKDSTTTVEVGTPEHADFVDRTDRSVTLLQLRYCDRWT